MLLTSSYSRFNYVYAKLEHVASKIEEKMSIKISIWFSSTKAMCVEAEFYILNTAEKKITIIIIVIIIYYWTG